MLADRGFTCAESFAIYSQSELIMPAFTKGKAQLTASDEIESRKLSDIRIHIECILGGIKKKSMKCLTVLPICVLMGCDSNISVADKFVTACCALHNLRNPIVPFD